MSFFSEDEIIKMVEGDTKRILRMEYTRPAIEMKLDWWESPIFDSLAADRFASDRESKAEKHFHIWSDMPCFCVDDEDEFNLGDYR